ncbi:PTS fructose-like transporter subunit IIB [Photobacterium satsumensis]
MMKLLGVTSCPSGVAHTYMAAEALETAAKAKGWEVKIETQGSIGIENEILLSEVEDADIVILTKDIAIKNEERFKGKKTVRIGVADAVKKAPQIMDKIEAHLASA